MCGTCVGSTLNTHVLLDVVRPVEQVLKMLLYLSLLVLGYELTNPIRYLKHTLKVVTMRLVISPILMIGLLLVHGMPQVQEQLKALLVESSAPSAIICVVFAKLYNLNAKLVAGIITVTTLIALPTLVVITLA